MAVKNNPSIEPSKVTKPIQLLAAWLVGLILVNGSFLGTAAMLNDKLLEKLLVIASIINVPIFLISIFLLQTKFRPEMQEDTFYSKYIDKKFGSSKREITPEAIESIKKQIDKTNNEQSDKIMFIEDSLKEITKQLENLPTGEVKLELREVKEKLVQLDKVKHEHVAFLNKIISLNQRLENFKDINKALKDNEVPVHELFGRNTPENFTVAIGDGFTQIEILVIMKAILVVTDGIIVYAGDEGEIDQYRDMVLIGSYGTSSGLSISNFIELVDGRNLSIPEIYRLIGK